MSVHDRSAIGRQEPRDGVQRDAPVLGVVRPRSDPAPTAGDGQAGDRYARGAAPAGRRKDCAAAAGGFPRHPVDGSSLAPAIERAPRQAGRIEGNQQRFDGAGCPQCVDLIGHEATLRRIVERRKPARDDDRASGVSQRRPGFGHGRQSIVAVSPSRQRVQNPDPPGRGEERPC